MIDAVNGPVHTVDNVWEPDRDVLDFKENKVGVTTVSKYDYGVNELGQRVTVAQSGTAFASARGIGWGYDALGQVTSADSTENTHDRAYQYDAIGNRIEARDGVTAVSGTPNYAANLLNQYTSVGSVSPVHDDDGNLISGQIPVGSAGLVWDAENRLSTVSVTGGGTVHYLYDSQSRRIASILGATTLVTVYDGWNPAARYGFGDPLPSVECRYTWGPDLSGTLQGAGGVGGLLAVRIDESSAWSRYFPLYDGNGNITEYVDGAGAVDAHFEYDPFGRPALQTGNHGRFSHRFSTKPLDAETGLYYYGYRYYDPVTGRWPSRDPIGEKGGVNLYGFVGNARGAVNGFRLVLAPVSTEGAAGTAAPATP